MNPYQSVLRCPSMAGRRMCPDLAISAQPRPLVARSTSRDFSPLSVSCACTPFFDPDIIRVLSTRANSTHTLKATMDGNIFHLLYGIRDWKVRWVQSSLISFRLLKSKTGTYIILWESPDSHQISTSLFAFGSIPTHAKSNYSVSQSAPPVPIASPKADAVQLGSIMVRCYRGVCRRGIYGCC